uniref:STEAP3 metalloreductase n=1 Tax=Salmo trutta TaxID=8032 RepID=A0A674D0L1_SALTR
MRTPLLSNSFDVPEEPLPCDPGNPTVGILGSGDYSRSLAVRLVACGYRVVVGSRNPKHIAIGQFPDGVQLLTQREAMVGTEKVVFAALYPEHYHTLVGLRDVLAGKVLVDVSNATKLNSGEPSNAERLAELFPESRVVKGFNVVSAWALQTGAHDGSRQAGVEHSWEEPQVWRSDLYLSSGILGLGVLTLLAITSLPSVGNALSWREFTFVQSGLGYAALTLSIMHTLFFSWDFAFFSFAYPYYMPPTYLLALILPCLVLVGRLFLALPCLAFRLAKIRRGWESPCHHPPQTQEDTANGVLPRDLSGDV